MESIIPHVIVFDDAFHSQSLDHVGFSTPPPLAIVGPMVTAHRSRPHGWAHWFQEALSAGGTGGLNWHLHALSSLKRWEGTLSAIDAFLGHITPRSNQLVLLGGSAGWMMPPAWLQRFRRIDAYDIDPLAPWLFKLRHGKALQARPTEIHFHRSDAIAGLPALLDRHPDAFVWFDNLLGQLRYRLGDEDAAERQLGQLKHVLHGREWGSLHDMYSGPTDEKTQLNRSALALTHPGTPLLDDAGTQRLLQKLDAQGVWQDHATRVVFPQGTATQWIPWAFRPHYWHWLEAGWVKPSN